MLNLSVISPDCTFLHVALDDSNGNRETLYCKHPSAGIQINKEGTAMQLDNKRDSPMQAKDTGLRKVMDFVADFNEADVASPKETLVKCETEASESPMTLATWGPTFKSSQRRKRRRS